jgi:hypothetical protein
MIDYQALKQEIVRDPQRLGYNGLDPEGVAARLNLRQFYQSDLISHRDQDRVAKAQNVLYVTTESSKFSVFGLRVGETTKRSRAEVLFGAGTVVTTDDVDLALLLN